jgi:hypothetical protein
MISNKNLQSCPDINLFKKPSHFLVITGKRGRLNSSSRKNFGSHRYLCSSFIGYKSASLMTTWCHPHLRGDDTTGWSGAQTLN